MKKIKLILTSLLLIAFIGCEEDERGTEYINNASAPSDVALQFRTTQDNSGLVTITPTATGATQFEVFFGDGTEGSATLDIGQSVDNIYAEGTYNVRVIATSINGKSTLVEQPLVVSFQAPQNLVVTIENDAAVSKQVNVTATADFAMSYDVYFGEPGIDTPLSANIGESVSYVYEEAGTYTITVIAMGSAIETTTYIEENFEVTAIEAPIVSAETPPFRAEADVISLYTEVYSDIPDTDFFPNWGQGDCCGSSWGTYDLDGDEMLQYTNISYQGNQLAAPIDVSNMEYLHLDIWTAEVLENIEVSLISVSNGERPIIVELSANAWTSVDIPISAFTDQDGFMVTDIHQLKYLGTPFSGGGTAFIDNIYFYKSPSEFSSLLFDDFEGNGNISTWSGDSAELTLGAPNVVNESINTSLSVAKYEDTGGQYANIQFVADSKFDLSGGNSVFSIKVYVPSSSVSGAQPNQVSLKLQNSDLGGNSWQTQTEIIKPIVLDEWQELTFDFATDPFINLDGNSPDPVDRSDLDKVVIQLNSENNNDTVTGYIDDFAYGSGLPVDAPPFATDDFEGNGTITTWLGDGTSIDTNFANPIDGSVAGINYSSTVLLYEDTGGQYANAQFTVSQKFDLTAKNKFTLKVYVPSSSITGSQPNQISLKLQNSDLGGNSWQTQTEIIKPIVLDAWQVLTFDFVNDTFINLDGNSPDPIDRTDLDKVVIQLNSENNNDFVTAYIDDFNYHK